jgi:hypothetical protein
MVDWLRLVYIRLFEMPSGKVPVYVIFGTAAVVAFLSAWWMQETGWPG